MIHNFHKDIYLIASDSRSVLECLYLPDKKGKYPKCIYKIKTIVKELTQHNINISFIWIPGHYGIVGNEIADKYAKKTLNLPDPVYNIKCLIPSINNYLSKEIKQTARNQLRHEAQFKGSRYFIKKT